MKDYPDNLHKPVRKQCDKFNASVMSHLLRTKMRKNGTFVENKLRVLEDKNAPAHAKIRPVGDQFNA